VPLLNRLHLERAVRVLRGGGVIAHATEGVWGLACDPAVPQAVTRIVQLKGRRADKGFILVAGSARQVMPLLAHLDATQRDAVLRSWPGPVTWIVPAVQEVPRWITGKHRSIAIRVSDHYQVAALCELFGGPLLSHIGEPARAPARAYGARGTTLLPGRASIMCSRGNWAGGVAPVRSGML
jgi:L-threonylcarbamoyladenylate synthase